jgi:NAD(P)H-hydrate epimerase
MSLPLRLYSVAQVRELDARAITGGVPGYTLMKRAGEASLRALRSRWPRALRIVVVAGGGNNGGDGYVLARFAQAAGLEALVLAAVPPQRLTGDARTACDDCIASGGRVLPFDSTRLAEGDVIVDAVLGTGLIEPVRPGLVNVIAAMNASGRPVLALDLPSGLNADSGAVMGAAVRADSTITFVALKTGLFLGEGPDLCGRLSFDDLEVAIPEEARFRPRLERLSEADLERALPRRRRVAHKGEFGRVLVVGGGPGMPGAVRLAGEAALRVGAGLVSVATLAENVAAVVGSRPELMCHAVATPADIAPLLSAADVIALGPGLGRGAWSRAMFVSALAAGKPLVIDADALNLLADFDERPPPGAILTPHPGEAGRLLQSDSTSVQADRMEALERLVALCAGVVVLKGAGTLIGAPGRTPALCERGNPGMAAPGMGDVLTGAIAGLLAQTRDAQVAARAGVLIHALAGDELARLSGERGILALDVAEALTRWANQSG